jgi:hypothetical protein
MEQRGRKFLSVMLQKQRRALIVGALVALASAARAGDEPDLATLPDLHQFLNEVRERLHTDEYLLDQYTFTERHTERHLDSQGRTEKVIAEVYEVYPSAEPGQTYRRLVARDGKALDAKELAKEDRKREEKTALDSTGTAQLKRFEAKAEARSREQKAVEELFRVYDMAIVGRELLAGRRTILVTFQPRADFEPTTKTGKILKKFTGRAWIDEGDRQVVRVEGDLLDDLSFGFGILARLRKGARAELVRRKVNDEIWLPAEARFIGAARVLLVKTIRLDTLSEYSDYKKFTVATESTVKSESKEN